MKKGNMSLIILILGIMVLFSTISSVDATIVKELGTSNVDYKDMVKINNDKAPNFIKASKYLKSAKYSKTKGFEKRKNILKTKYGKKYIFITKYFLPMSWKNGGKNGKTEYWYNCQSVVINGKYMYLLTSSGYGMNKGFVIRYDRNILDKYNGKSLVKLRKLGAAMRDGKKLTKSQKSLKKAIKIGPKFIVGHGQSLTYNPKTKSLWMWQDNAKNSNNLKLMKINKKTLKPSIIYKFKVKNTEKYFKQFHNLAFDRYGNFYTDKIVKTKKNPNGYICIFSGRLNHNKIKMKLLTIIKKRPGIYSQSLAINNKNKRLYLVSDGAIYSIPMVKLLNGNLKESDFYYTLFKTKREFESISFDKYGKAYLLILRGTEILKSNQIY
ncbi:hypothetical protein SDC9_17038 [bioreactor metagenome]|uniref:Uncharacterized protein n=1 Tax=bioreactor metagenome TaxID=1076179 RepID=A0A644TWA9_9ZZZZ|nr:hypothetical protein [Methanobrevibacter sp.]MEA4957091.1 hypothetical protein [Methanobrevibacter sp.]